MNQFAKSIQDIPPRGPFLLLYFLVTYILGTYWTSQHLISDKTRGQKGKSYEGIAIGWYLRRSRLCLSTTVFSLSLSLSPACPIFLSPYPTNASCKAQKEWRKVHQYAASRKKISCYHLPWRLRFFFSFSDVSPAMTSASHEITPVMRTDRHHTAFFFLPHIHEKIRVIKYKN